MTESPEFIHSSSDSPTEPLVCLPQPTLTLPGIADKHLMPRISEGIAEPGIIVQAGLICPGCFHSVLLD